MSKKLKTITSLEAWNIIRQDPRTLLIDVRSSMEYLFVGHPKGALHIPWIDEPDWVINEDFVTEIRKLALGGVKASSTDDVPIILICRSGNRSDEAGKLLVASGIRNVYHIDDGFEGKLDENHHRSTLGGWRYHDLPWEQC
jgi:rhodanese-related sulfurtransferase